MIIHLKKNIELFQDLSQFDIEKVCYDLHNDFNCENINFHNGLLTLVFNKINTHHIVSLNFEGTDIEKLELGDQKEQRELTIDSLYRGRYEQDNRLVEFNEDGKSYFYAEFYNGTKLEFWCTNAYIETD